MPRLVAALLLVLVLGIDRGTGAVWSDTGEVRGGQIHTGRVDLRVDGADAVPDLAPLDLPLLVPGQTAATVLLVANQGDVPLEWTASTAGAGPAGLLGAVEVLLTGATATDGSTCGGTPVSGSRTLEPGVADRVCVQVGLPAGAPSSVAGQAVELAVTFDAVTGGWSDEAVVGGVDLATVAVEAPTVTCSGLLGLDLTMSWEAVPGASAYRLVDALGAVVRTVLPGDLLEVDLGALLGVRVEAVYGSGWTSTGSSC